MALSHSPNIVTDGLVLCLDAGNQRSYPGSGTTWRDLSGNQYNFTLINSPIFALHKGIPCFVFSGANDYATRFGSIRQDISTECTLNIMMSSINNTNFGQCSRLFSVNDGSTNNVDYNTYFTLASCDQNKFGLWYKGTPGGLYPTSSLKTINDDYKFVTYKWTTSNTAFVLVNGIQESSSNITSPFDYRNIQRMTIGMNSSLNIENSTIRVALVQLYNRELTISEIQQNHNAIKGKFGL